LHLKRDEYSQAKPYKRGSGATCGDYPP